MKAFIPPLNSTWRLTRDWRLPQTTVKRYGNEDTFSNIFKTVDLMAWLNENYPNRTSQDRDWVPVYNKAVDDEIGGYYDMSEGTVLKFERYHGSNSGDQQITLVIVSSPELRLTPKKQGGKGKGKMRFYINMEDFNNLPELESVE